MQPFACEFRIVTPARRDALAVYPGDFRPSGRGDRRCAGTLHAAQDPRRTARAGLARARPADARGRSPDQELAAAHRQPADAAAAAVIGPGRRATRWPMRWPGCTPSARRTGRCIRAGDLQSVDFGQTLADICAHIGGLTPSVQLHCHAETGLQLDAERAIPLGLLVSELLTNAAKHAYPGASGQVSGLMRR